MNETFFLLRTVRLLLLAHTSTTPTALFCTRFSNDVGDISRLHPAVGVQHERTKERTEITGSTSLYKICTPI